MSAKVIPLPTAAAEPPVQKRGKGPMHKVVVPQSRLRIERARREAVGESPTSFLPPLSAADFPDEVIETLEFQERLLVEIDRRAADLRRQVEQMRRERSRCSSPSPA